MTKTKINFFFKFKTKKKIYFFSKNFPKSWKIDRKNTRTNQIWAKFVLFCLLLYFRKLQALKTRLYQPRLHHLHRRRCHHRRQHSFGCHRPPAVVSTNHKSVHTVDALFHATIRLKDTFRINTNNPTHCMYANFAIDDIVPKIHWQRTKVYSIGAPVVCLSVYWKHRRSKM